MQNSYWSQKQSLEPVLKLYKLFQVIGLPLLPLVVFFCLSHKKYRTQFMARIGARLPKLDRQSQKIWIHAMSLGEYNAARPLIKVLSSAFSDATVIVSASTQSGLNAIKKDKINRNIITAALPYDLFFITKRVARRLCPDCFILVETDLWPCFLWDLHRQGCPIILANGSISSSSARRLQKIPQIAQFLYEPFTRLCMQSNDDAKRLKRLGITHDKIDVFGNLKSDIILPSLTGQMRDGLFKATGFSPTNTVLCAGSTHDPEEEILLEVFCSIRKTYKNLKMIVAPRDIKRAREVKKICSRLGLACRLRSKTRQHDTSDTPDVYILDTLGELKNFYTICHLAFVGGSLAPVGGHNVFEPAHLGKPVLFGPYIESCKEMADALMNKEAGFMVKDRMELERTIKKLLTDHQSYEAAKRATGHFSQSSGRVSNRYLELVKGLLHDHANAKEG